MTTVLCAVMAITVHLFTFVVPLYCFRRVFTHSMDRIHHPFLLSDNRHYTFYVWRRIFCLHPVMPYLFIPGYVACGWAWFLRVGERIVVTICRGLIAYAHDSHVARDQTLLQTLILPIFVLPTLLPTPLLEPRYFLIPYVLLRAQVIDVRTWGLAIEATWYAAINAVTMGVFLYAEREGVGRFMW